MYAPMFWTPSQQQPGTTATAANAASRSPGVVGIANGSFNCYANAAIQALANCPPLIRFLRDQEAKPAKKETDDLEEKFSKIILEIWSEKTSNISADVLLDALRTKTKLFEKDVQHDSQEFIHFLMVLLKEERTAKHRKKGSKFQRCDSGLGSLPVICHSSSVEEEEEEEEAVNEIGKEVKQEKEEKQEKPAEILKTVKEEKDTETLKRCDSGLELRLTSTDNLASIFEATIEVTTRCHACNKDSRVSEVSETIRVPIPTKLIKRDKDGGGGGGGGANAESRDDHVVTEQPIATAESQTPQYAPAKGGSAESRQPNPAELSHGNSVEKLNSADSVQLVWFSPSELSKESSASETESASSEAVTCSITPAASASASAAAVDGGKNDSKPDSAAEEEARRGFAQCFKSFWCAVGSALCGVSIAPEVAVEQAKDTGSRERDGLLRTLTLARCVEEMFKAETLDGDNRYKCEACDQLTDASRKVQLRNLPEILIFQLMRFTFEKGKVDKVQDSIEIQPVIDMAKYLPEEIAQTEKRKTDYELVSVICHHGGSNGGHYTTFAKNDGSKLWHYFDDTKTSQVSLETVLRQQAYILFYRRL